MATGTYTIADLIAVRFQSAKALGLDTIAQVLQADLAAHNAIVDDMLGDLCEVTSDARRIYGTSNAGTMTEVDEFGAAPSQKATGGVEVGFPLRLFQYNLGWTRKFLENATVGDLVQRQLDAQKAHMKEIQRQIKKAVFAKTNYTFVDFLVDNVALSVKRFVNADSASIPDGPNGEAFDGASHSHFTQCAQVEEEDLVAAINTVIEHGHGGHVILAVNKAQEAAVRGLTDFVAYPDPRIIYRDTDTPGQTLNISRLDNRAVGILGGAEVWVKSWVPAYYQFAYDAADARKPLAFRQRNGGGLQIASTFDSHPLQAEFMEAEFGVGVWTRTNGAVHYSNNSSWSDATIA